MTISPLPFIDQANSVILIGSDSNKTSFFTGFIYQISAYANPPQVYTLADITNCTDCSICLTTGTCISICSYGQYYSSSSRSCINCPTNCPNCKSSSACNLCVDSNCIQCKTYQPNSCILCETGYVVQNNLCVVCIPTTYYDLSSKSCLQCQGLCVTCISSKVCMTCLENSSIDPDNYCVCNLGYTGSTTCIRNNFTVSISVDQKNIVYLTFSEPLSTPLQITDIDVILNSSIIGFSITEKATSYFAVNIDFQKDITATGNKVDISFLNNLTSTANSLLIPPPLEISLFPDPGVEAQIVLKKQVAAAQQTASTGSYIGISVVFGSSLLNFNLVSIFDFMNTAEILYFIYLFNIELHPVLSEFLLNLNPAANIPNVFTFIIDASKANEISEKYKKYGYDNNLLLLNVGVEFALLSATLTFFIIVSLLSCNN